MPFRTGHQSNCAPEPIYTQRTAGSALGTEPTVLRRRRGRLRFGRAVARMRHVGDLGRAKRVSLAATIIVASLSMAVTPARAAPELGSRVGAGADFDMVGVYGRWSAPLVEPYLPPRFEVGWELAWERWRAARETIDSVAFGPVFEYPAADSLRVRIGVQPTLLSDYRAGGVDLGGHVQFTSHVGATWRMAPRLTLGLRLQHTSNAGLYRPNPGVDMLTAGLSYRF